MLVKLLDLANTVLENVEINFSHPGCINSNLSGLTK